MRGYTRAFDHVGVLGAYVAADSRRRGVAARLFEATFGAALAKGYEKIFTYVRADNDAALRVLASGIPRRRHGPGVTPVSADVLSTRS